MPTLKMWQRALLETAGLPLDPAQWGPFTIRRMAITFPSGDSRTAYCCGITVGLEPQESRADCHARDEQRLVLILNGYAAKQGAPTPRMPWLVLDLNGQWRLRAQYDDAGACEDTVSKIEFL